MPYLDLTARIIEEEEVGGVEFYTLDADARAVIGQGDAE